MNLADVMDEIAARLDTLDGLRVHASPPGNITPPAAIVSYPDSYIFDETYGRGADRMTLPVVLALDRPTDRGTRDRLAKYVNGSGADSIKALLDGDDYTSCESVRVQGAEFDVYGIGGGEYLTAVFTLDIAGEGADS